MPEQQQPKTVLEEAQALVYGDRQSDYGHPRENFETIARMWNEYLADRNIVALGNEMTAADAAIMMLLLKIARHATGELKRDTVADMAGYVAVLARVTGLDD